MISEAKVVIIGTVGVGKSSLTIRFVYDQFNENIDSTLGAVYFEKLHNYNESKNIKFQLWDTAGQEKYKSIARIYYKDSKVAVVVYDVTRMESFEALKVWIEELKVNAPKDMIIAIVGNKIDLDQQQQVPYQTALDYANSLQAIFKLTSAKDDKGIKDLFDSIAIRIEQAELMLEESVLKKGEKIKNGKANTQKNGKKKCCA